MRARRQNDSQAQYYCFQKSTDGNEAHLGRIFIIFCHFLKYFIYSFIID